MLEGPGDVFLRFSPMRAVRGRPSRRILDPSVMSASFSAFGSIPRRGLRAGAPVSPAKYESAVPALAMEA
jgi:hypothetical protein